MCEYDVVVDQKSALLHLGRKSEDFEAEKVSTPEMEQEVVQRFL